MPQVTTIWVPSSQTPIDISANLDSMTQGLERWYGGQDLHFITCSCYRRRPELDSGERRDLFVRVLERARQKYRFVA